MRVVNTFTSEGKFYKSERSLNKLDKFIPERQLRKIHFARDVSRLLKAFFFSCFGLDELGDYDREVHTENYVSSLKFALRQSAELEKKVIEAHRKREPGQDIATVYDEFILIARSLETYGIDPHPVKDYRGTQLYVGINFSGISTFSVGKRIQHFRWPEISKINFEGKMFIVHLTYTVSWANDINSKFELRNLVSSCTG